MLLSLLIPTLEGRKPQFLRLTEHLNNQIQQAGLVAEVQILHLTDSGERSIGRKRNLLLGQAAGEFIVFVDDDDDVSDDYVRLICAAIRRRPQADCIGIRGVITFRGREPREFVHSIQYSDFFSVDHKYYRPPMHVNPIRRSIAIRYAFADVSYSEDIDWALRMRDDGALQDEEFIDAVLYYYRSRRHWFYQWALDRTETVRHKFGIRLANRLRFWRSVGTRPS